jgi:hypothetical protein
VIDRLSADLRERFPGVKGYSARNLKYMRAFAVAWPNPAIVQRGAAQFPWRHHQLLLDKLSDAATRLWYAEQATANGWSRDVLGLQIERRLHERTGKAVNNFAATLPPEDSDLVETESLPTEVISSLPTIEQLEAELTDLGEVPDVVSADEAGGGLAATTSRAPK